MPYIARGYDRYIGTVVPSGHSYDLVRECAGLPHPSQWRQGSLVRGMGFVRGTCIATFGEDERYGFGFDHCAILLAEVNEGLLVVDQRPDHPVRRSLLHYRFGQGPAMEDGCMFYTIELVEDLNATTIG